MPVSACPCEPRTPVVGCRSRGPSSLPEPWQGRGWLLRPSVHPPACAFPARPLCTLAPAWGEAARIPPTLTASPVPGGTSSGETLPDPSGGATPPPSSRHMPWPWLLQGVGASGGFPACTSPRRPPPPPSSASAPGRPFLVENCHLSLEGSTDSTRRTGPRTAEKTRGRVSTTSDQVAIS